MRTRWIVLVLGLSLAVNVTFGVALWISWHGAPGARAAFASACATPLCDEEKKVREELASSLCAREPDRAVIGATLARLDAVRARERDEIIDRWLARCSSAGSGERAALSTTVKRFLCPWCISEDAATRAPSKAPGARSDKPKQHGQS